MKTTITLDTLEAIVKKAYLESYKEGMSGWGTDIFLNEDGTFDLIEGFTSSNTSTIFHNDDCIEFGWVKCWWVDCDPGNEAENEEELEYFVKCYIDEIWEREQDYWENRVNEHNEGGHEIVIEY